MTDRLHVMNLRNVIAFGGPDTTLLGWCAHIDRSRFRVSVTSFENPGAPDARFLERLRARDIETHSIPWGRRKRLIAALSILTRLIKERRVDLLHTHDIRADVLGYLAARAAGIPVMTTIYVWFQSTSMRKIRYFEKIDRMFLRHFDGLTAISEATRQQTISYGFPAESVETIYSGIEIDEFNRPVDVDTTRRSLGAAPGDRLLVYVARLYPEKAHRLLIDAMQEVVKFVPNARLVLLGDGPCRNDLQMQVGALKLSAHVIFAGIRTDVPDVLRGCEIMVHPSLAEGIPLGAQEGMAAGLPVVGTNVDGTPEVVVHEQTGLLVPVNDVPQLSKAMIRLLSDRPLAQRLGAAARTLITTRLSASRVTRQVEQVYLRVHRDFHARTVRRG